MPYRAMIAELNKRLAVEKDASRRQALEVSLLVLLGLMDIMKQIQEIKDTGK